MPDEIDIRHASGDDVESIVEVLAASLGETPLLERTPELFAWKHFDNPFGTSIVLVAEIEGRMAGVRALMRWKLLTVNGEVVSCVRAVDTATHPDFQGRGVFRELTMSAVEQAKSEGVDLIFNTPNEKSAPGYLKMGWDEVGQVRPLVRPRLEKAVRPGPDQIIPLSDTLKYVSEFEPVDMEREPTGLRTPRTPEYQRWRFNQHPTARYGWVGEDSGRGAVVRSSVRRGRVELLVTELTSGARLLRTLARTHRARYMAASFSSGTPERKAARWAGMFRPPGVQGLRLVANQLSTLDFDVFNIASWDLSLGDMELL